MIERIFRKKVHGADFPRRFREANKGRDISDGRIEELRGLLGKPGAVRASTRPEFSLEHVLTIMNTLSRMIFKMGWRFAIPPIGKHFITNDNPVVWYDGSAPALLRHALASQNTILLFPVGPEVALIGSWLDGPDGYERVDEKVVDSINQWVVSSADRWIVASRKDEAASALSQWQELNNQGVTLGPLQLKTFEIEDLGIGAVLR